MKISKAGVFIGGWAVTVLVGCTAVVVPGGDNNLNATEVVVGSGFVSAARTGTTTGVSDDSICDGWYPETPNHVLQIDASLGMAITAEGVNGEDVRLWAQSGQSNFCGDGGSVQELARFWTRGSIDIYVGTTSNGFTAEYNLSFDPN